VIIVWDAEVAACDNLRVGPDVLIAAGGRAHFRAGGQVSLGNRVSVNDGGRLAIATGSVLPPPVEDVAYREDFEDGFALGWDNSNRLTDLWRIDAGCSTPPSGSKTLSFSRSQPDCDYDLAGAVPFGWARSPILDLSDAATATLQLVHRFETEGGTTWDQMAIQASSDGGATWTTVWTRATGATAGFVVESVDVSGFIGPRFRFRFVFDAVDSILNDFGGWSIDEVMVTVD
jgi:trimeric autotransporter adhesin